MMLISDLHQQWSNDPEYQAAYETQRSEFEIADAIIAARSSANLTQKELAQLMSAKQSLIARLETGEQISFLPQD